MSAPASISGTNKVDDGETVTVMDRDVLQLVISVMALRGLPRRDLMRL